MIHAVKNDLAIEESEDSYNEDFEINIEGFGELKVYCRNQNQYVFGKQVCTNIGLSIDQCKGIVKRIKDDIFLKDFTIIDTVPSYEGVRLIQNRNVRLLELKCLPIWISYINRNSLNDEQLNKVINILNYCLSEDFQSIKNNNPIYSFESLLRDEIYNNGCFDDINIIAREVKYDFGRVDLVGVDKNHQKVIVELKKYNDYKDVINQCLKYKKGFNKLKENVRIIICAYDCSGFLEEANTYNFECYEYKRDLKLTKSIHN